VQLLRTGLVPMVRKGLASGNCQFCQTRPDSLFCACYGKTACFCRPKQRRAVVSFAAIFASEKMDQIFSAFFTTKPQASGMGPAISRSIVESPVAGRGRPLTADEVNLPFHFTDPGHGIIALGCPRLLAWSQLLRARHCCPRTTALLGQSPPQLLHC
jgi:hypothetical protein